MSDETQQNDPWADDATASAPADADGIDWSNVGEGEDEFGDILAGIELEEIESGEAIRVRDDSAKKYDNPYDVGLKDGMWVPVRILTAEVHEKHIPRLNKQTCVAKKDGKVVGVLFDDVQKALKEGAQEVIGEIPLPYFVCTANHVAPRFGQRHWDWEIEVPAFTIKTARYRPRPGYDSGFRNEDGKSLRKATGATATDDVVTQKIPAPEGQVSMYEVADKMVEAIVMAKVSISQSKRPKFRSRRDADGNEILVQINPETGDAVTVLRIDDDYIIEGSGEIYATHVDVDGETAALRADLNAKLSGGDLDDETVRELEARFKEAVAELEQRSAEYKQKVAPLVDCGENRFAIRDSGDLAGPLTEQYFPINDYINPPFLPMPERKVRVERAVAGEDGEPVYTDGEITLDTIGAVARGNAPGIQVDVMLRSGETITATWFGTEWVEKPSDGEGMEQFVGSVDDEQEKALASM